LFLLTQTPMERWKSGTNHCCLAAFLSNDSVGITYLETDSKAAPGSSGGPLIDMSGRVIGMLTLERTGITTTNRGYAISVTTLNAFLMLALNVK